MYVSSKVSVVLLIPWKYELCCSKCVIMLQIPKMVNSSRTWNNNNNRHVNKASGSTGPGSCRIILVEEEEMDLTTDDDHSILRLNDSCPGQSVTKTQREKKKSRQIESE